MSKTPEMEQAELRQNEAWAKVTDIWRNHKIMTDSVVSVPHNKPTQEGLQRWIVSTNGLYAKASEAYDNAVAMDKLWVKAANNS